MNTHQYVRPMNTRELFSSAYTLYKKHFRKLFLINLVVVVFNLISFLFAFITTFMGQAATTLTSNSFWSVLALLISFVPSIAGVVVSAAMIIAISNAVLERHINVRESYRRAWSADLIWKLIIVSVPFSLVFALVLSLVQQNVGRLLQQNAIFGVVIFLLLEFIVLSIISIMLAFIAPVAVLEKRNIVNTFKRLFTLFWGNIAHLLINYGLLWVMPLFFLSILLTNWLSTPIIESITRNITDLQTVFEISVFVGFVMGFIVSNVIGIFLNPFGTLLAALLYYDTRARKENYDETLLAEEMGYEAVAEMI